MYVCYSLVCLSLEHPIQRLFNIFINVCILFLKAVVGRVDFRAEGRIANGRIASQVNFRLACDRGQLEPLSLGWTPSTSRLFVALISPAILKTIRPTPPYWVYLRVDVPLPFLCLQAALLRPALPPESVIDSLLSPHPPSMSGIIASYFIEPVVRQARRFSNLPAPTSNDEIAIQGTGPSHATCSTANHDISDSLCQRARPPSTSSLTPLSSASAQRNPPASFLGQALFDRFVPLLTTSRNLPTTPDSHQPTRQPIHHPMGPSVPTSPLLRSGSCGQPCSEPINTTLSPEATSAIPTSSRVAADSAASVMSQSPYSRSLPVRLPDRSRAIQSIRRTSAREAGFPHGARFRTLDAVSVDAKPPGSLPEDDGQKHLRQRILDIWDMEISSEEKAKRMHEIMNESHRAAQRPKSPDSTTSGRPLSSSSSRTHILSLDTYSKPELPLSLDPANPYNIAPDDLIPSYRPQSAPDTPEPASRSDPLDEDSTSNSLEFEAGCVHYKRNVKVQCFACKTWWPCRICHDEAQLGHELPRQLTENMLCMTCKTPGPAGQYCKHCSARAAHYYCEVCKLWDDSNRSIYHCGGCGICRLGEGIGKDYEHCTVCDVLCAFELNFEY